MTEHAKQKRERITLSTGNHATLEEAIAEMKVMVELMKRDGWEIVFRPH
jgi:hypothetical protein